MFSNRAENGSLRNCCKTIFLLFCCFSFLCSCSNNACKEPMNTTMQVYFFSKSTGNPLPQESFSIYACKNDVLIPTQYVDTLGLSHVDLQLDYNDTISKYYFSTPTIRDTFVVIHKNTNVFVSAECGSRVVSKIDSFYYGRGQFGDSISIVNPNVNEYFNGKNVEIYFD